MEDSRPDKHALLVEFPQLGQELAECLDTIQLVCLSGYAERLRDAQGGATEL